MVWGRERALEGNDRISRLAPLSDRLCDLEQGHRHLPDHMGSSLSPDGPLGGRAAWAQVFRHARMADDQLPTYLSLTFSFSGGKCSLKLKKIAL